MSTKESIIPYERKLDSCLNCGHPLQGENYCPNCGQENTDKNISFISLTRDFFGDYFSFDSKFFSTLIPLIIHPGRVPQEFMAGHRVSHIPPLRTLIFSSFVFFFIWGLTFEPEIVQPTDFAAEMDKQIQEGFENKKLNPADSLIVVGTNTFHLDLTGLDSIEESSTLMKVDKLKELLDSGLRVDQAVDSIAQDNSPFESKLYAQIGKMYVSDSATLSKYFFSNFSIIILVIQPFFALLLKLLYIRRRKPFRFIQHLVFSLYYHGWMLIIATIGILIKQLYDGFNTPAFVTLLALMYLPMAIKRFYGQGWGKSLLKTFLIFMLYAGLIAPFFIVISVLLSFYFF